MPSQASQPMRTPLRSWALPSSLMLIAAAVTGVGTGDDIAGPMTRTILREVRASCPAAVVRRGRAVTVRDGAAATDRWAWGRLLEQRDGIDRCRLPYGDTRATIWRKAERKVNRSWTSRTK